MNKHDATEAVACYERIAHFERRLASLKELRTKSHAMEVRFRGRDTYSYNQVDLAKEMFSYNEGHLHSLAETVIDDLEKRAKLCLDAEYRRLNQLGFEKP